MSSRAYTRWAPQDVVLLGLLPLTLLGWWLYVFGSRHAVAVDFRYAFLGAAHAIVDGRTPFPTGAALGHFAYVYPPLIAVLTVPFVYLPALVAAWAWTLALLASIPLALWLFGVRDWRCLGAVLLWAPTFAAIQTGNLSLPLLLAAALVWRYRDGATGALSLGAAVAAKLIFWPLLLWLVAIRRYRTCVYAVGAAAVLLLVPWALIGFRGLAGYPHLSRIIARDEGPMSYALGSLSDRLFGGNGLGITVIVVVALVLAMLVAGLRGDARLSFALGILVTLVATPVLWLHYLVLLAAILAVYRPTFGPAWLAPLGLWACPGIGTTETGAIWQATLALGLSAFLVAWLGSRRPKGAAVPRSAPAGYARAAWSRARS